jgi:hypothetical protein
MLLVTIGGIFILSALIGILNNALQAKLDELRRGRSRVIEAGHTVILGWSPQVFAVISELVEANANQRDPCIVVLGERDKVAMESAIRDALGKTGRSRVVCRSGSPIVLTGDLISRIIAQTCRQSGLSVVYAELLDFGGDEIYFKEEPALVGKTFGEALHGFEDSAVMGLCTADGPRLNPPMDTVIRPGDQLITVSEDDDTIRLGGRGAAAVDRAAIQLRDADAATAERTLILGWNWRAPAIIRELDHYVAPGSEVTVVADVPDLEALTAGCRTLGGLRAETYRHVIVLAED